MIQYNTYRTITLTLLLNNIQVKYNDEYDIGEFGPAANVTAESAKTTLIQILSNVNNIVNNGYVEIEQIHETEGQKTDKIYHYNLPEAQISQYRLIQVELKEAILTIEKDSRNMSMDESGICMDNSCNDSDVELPRINTSQTPPQNQISTWTNVNPFDSSTSQWHDGTPITSQGSYNASLQVIEDHLAARIPPKVKTQPVRKTCTIRYLNIPHEKVRSPIRNMLKECTLTYPNADIFALCELYYRDHMVSFTPPSGFKIYMHKVGTIKTSAIMYRDTLDVKHIETNVPITCIEVKLGNRSIGNRSYFDYSEPFLKYIQEAIKNDKHVIFGDINWNLTDDGRPKNRYLEKWAINYMKDTVYANHWGRFNTRPTKRGGSKIDIWITAAETILGHFSIDRHERIYLSDHYCAALEIPYNSTIKTKETITTRRTLFKHKLKSRMEEERHHFPNRLISNITPEYDEFEKFATTTAWTEMMVDICDKPHTAWTPQDATLAYNKFCEICKFSRPERTTVINHQKRTQYISIRLHELRRTAVETFNHLKATNQNTVDNTNLKAIHAQLNREKRRCMREQWKQHLDKRVRETNLDWSLVNKYRDQIQEIPPVVAPDDFAKTFLKLMYDYTPRTDTPVTDFNIFSTQDHTESFDFKLPIKPKCNDFLTSLESYIFDGKGSQESA